MTRFSSSKFDGGEPIPSTNTSAPWIVAPDIPSQSVSDQSLNGGKWMIFVKPELVDKRWLDIKHAVETGRLWQAKVSTRQAFRPPNHVICVYTRNWRDKEDVFRAREVLRELGFTDKLYYKPDEMTAQGKSGSIYSG